MAPVPWPIKILRDVIIRDVTHGWKTTIVRIGRNSRTPYSNEIKITPLERSVQAQRNAGYSVFMGYTERKLRPFKILASYALVHYTYIQITYQSCECLPC